MCIFIWIITVKTVKIENCNNTESLYSQIITEYRLLKYNPVLYCNKMESLYLLHYKTG